MNVWCVVCGIWLFALCQQSGEVGMYPQRCFGLARAVPGFHHAQQRRGGKVGNRSVSDKAVKVCAHGRDSHWCQH